MERKIPSPLVLGLVITGLAVASFAAYYFLRNGRPDPEGEARLNPGPPTFEEPAPESDPATPPVASLEETDAWIRTVIGQVSEHPELVRWVMGHDGLVRRLAAAVDNVARGESPRAHLSFLEPRDGFRASEGGGRLTVDPRSFGRYDIARQAFISLDTASSVRLFLEVEPLFDEAYRELGYPDGHFRGVLLQAIDHVLATPIPEDEIELDRRVDSYHFADPALEALSPAQKHYLRMGAGNMRQLHAKLRLMKTTLELTPTGDEGEDAEPVAESAPDTPREGGE